MTWPSQQSCLTGLAGLAVSGAHCILAMLSDGTVDNGMFAWQSSHAVVSMSPSTRACCCRYVACMNPTAGSFVVNPRLQRLFMTLAVEFPGQESLMKIYGTFVTGHLKKFSADVQVTPCLCITLRIRSLHGSAHQAVAGSGINTNLQSATLHGSFRSSLQDS